MAVPSARNSGFDRTSNRRPRVLLLRIRSIASAVRTGSVDFSTTILSLVEQARICRAVFSQYCRSAARPAPSPNVFVGVFTDTKMMSAAAMPASMSVEKKRFLPRARFTTSSRPGSKMGSSSDCQALMRAGLMSTTVTVTCGHRSAMTAIVGPRRSRRLCRGR